MTARKAHAKNIHTLTHALPPKAIATKTMPAKDCSLIPWCVSDTEKHTTKREFFPITIRKKGIVTQCILDICKRILSVVWACSIAKAGNLRAVNRLFACSSLRIWSTGLGAGGELRGTFITKGWRSEHTWHDGSWPKSLQWTCPQCLRCPQCPQRGDFPQWLLHATVRRQQYLVLQDKKRILKVVKPTAHACHIRSTSNMHRSLRPSNLPNQFKESSDPLSAINST